jgi:hypothetical protein
MSCCPSVKCRNTGSGYVKPTGATAESNKKLDELLAARMAQDVTYFPPIHGNPAATTHANVCSTGTCVPSQSTKK